MDEKFMLAAIEEAGRAGTEDEVPVGAVIVLDGEIIGVGRNRKEQKKSAVYHAEIEAINDACRRLNNWHLDGCDLYVTLEPCPMCAGAIIQSRIKNLYFGAYDEKAGCCGTLYNLVSDNRFNHRVNVKGGILEKECAELLSGYFKLKRGKRAQG
ncbi:MAG: tRNA adenosine(34) deaminase TadA [Christensenellales bacterium]|jgi:tRNA(adenine34) deaminase|nr:tRNA adenosine(34) deaminase TadA [Eubacteriales bacterium]